jgi:hypothetical protein
MSVGMKVFSVILVLFGMVSHSEATTCRVRCTYYITDMLSHIASPTPGQSYDFPNYCRKLCGQFSNTTSCDTNEITACAPGGLTCSRSYSVDEVATGHGIGVISAYEAAEAQCYAQAPRVNCSPHLEVRVGGFSVYGKLGCND